jgi:hypothetical protein
MKISDLPEITDSNEFDPKKDQLITEIDGSCRSITMSEITKVLDVRRISSNKTAWAFIELENSVNSDDFVEIKDAATGGAETFPLEVKTNEQKLVSIKLAGNPGKDPPDGARLVMFMAKAQNIELSTRFRSEQVNLFKVNNTPSAILFMLENIQDVTFPTKSVEYDPKFPTFGSMPDTLNNALSSQQYYANLTPIARAQILGPIMSNPQLRPRFDYGSQQDINLDARNFATIAVANKQNQTGFLESIRPIAWSF